MTKDKRLPPVVLHIPHASRMIPEIARSSFLPDDTTIERELLLMTDAWTDEIVENFRPEAERIIFPVSRLVVDPERFRDDSDEPMAAKGMGATYTRLSSGEPLRILGVADRFRLLETYYDPHHARLERVVADALSRHGRCLIIDRLKNGFMATNDPDVDGFVSFSMSVHNRRKSRQGHALEHHLKAVFNAHKLKFDHGKKAKTEGNAKPDFLFPGGKEYHDASFHTERLTLLGAKSTCKDRWRQVLAEGARVKNKHLITLEPSISIPQTDEMKSFDLQLILPKSIHATYKPVQQSWLMDIAGFVSMVKDRQP